MSPERVRRPATGTSPEIAARLRAEAKHGAQPRRFAVATATAALIFTLLVVSTVVRGVIAELVASPLKTKLAGADRIAYYVLPEDLEHAPSFRVGPNDLTLKLVTHLVLPESTVFDENEDYAYGVRLNLESLDGTPLWEHEVNIRTRQSKSGGDPYGWRYENSFLLDDPETKSGAREITDDRLTRVRLPISAEGTDRRLFLSFVPREPSSAVEGLARVYVQRERAADDRTLRELSLDPRVAADMVDHLTYRDWEQLSDKERRQKLGFVWERMSAEGDVGVDYQLLSIYYTGFRLPRHTKTDRRRLVVEDTRSLAINVLGPAVLELEVFGDESVEVPGLEFDDALLGASAAGIDSASEHARVMTIKRRSLDGEVTLEPSQARLRTLPIDEGVHTLIIESPIRTELTLDVIEAPPEAPRVWLIEADRPRRLDDEGNEVLEPDVRRIQVVRVGANWSELPRWAIMGPPEIEETRVFRVDVRVVNPLASTWWPPEQEPTPEVELCFLDAAGELLGCEPWQGRPARESHFEGLRLGDAGDASKQRWYEVSEPQSWRFVAPLDAASFMVRTPEGASEEVKGQRLIVRAYGYWPEVATLVGLPFREYQSEQMIWRYPPLDFRTWFPLRPINYDALQDDTAIADLLAQVRLQPRGTGDSDDEGKGGSRRSDRWAGEHGGEDGWDPGPWVTLEPRGIHRRRSILEELGEGATNRLATRWDPSLWTELWPKRQFSVDLGATGPGAPQLHWQVEPRVLGRSVELTIDGETHSYELRETRGRWTLPVDEGRHKLTFALDAANADYEMWLDRPILVASPPVSRRRTVHELTSSLIYPLVKKTEGELSVNVVVYLLRKRERAELALQIDDGAPQRKVGVPVERLSVVDRSYSIDAEGAFDERDRMVDERAQIRFVDLEGNNRLPLDVATIRITLGEDIPPGEHTVRVRLLDGQRVWVRAFHRGVGDRGKSATSWTEAAGPGVADPWEGELE